ncbi:hypothetical protein FIBSPDRAFT_887557 [Athelia psychrophila]|uniref:Uncharacterized protein n=1 Tax=Athelia psychrophila TaxID=1759441 RepID=A0A166PKN2_9AGAM|nr:hypothetical protein FIBSPDRAFT_887557 [Fibularhizoctonia sp. CBS 109695]
MDAGAGVGRGRARARWEWASALSVGEHAGRWRTRWTWASALDTGERARSGHGAHGGQARWALTSAAGAGKPIGVGDTRAGERACGWRSSGPWAGERAAEPCAVDWQAALGLAGGRTKGGGVAAGDERGRMIETSSGRRGMRF